MNGPICMYKTRQIVQHNIPVILPTCMYKLKSIHNTERSVESHHHVPSSGTNLDIFDQVKQFLKNNQKLSGMAELELKQEQILHQLAELKKQMTNIRKQLKLNENGCTSVPLKVQQININQEQLKNIPEVVINASPTNPPYSLQLVQKLWQNYVHLGVVSYLHSTVSSLNENTANFVKNVENFQPKLQVPRVDVKLIWKNIGPDVELVVSKTPIHGEANILRFLSRLFPNQLSYETSSNANEVDSLLDVAYGIARAKTKTDRANLLHAVTKSLGKNQWLAGRNEIGIADIAIYSAIKQSCSSNEINANLTKWLERISNC